MKYKKFSIKNFKGISSLELDFSKYSSARIFPFVGLNESGKTTILEALNWFYSDQDYDPEELVPKNLKANFNDDIEVIALIELSDDDIKKQKHF